MGWFLFREVDRNWHLIVLVMLSLLFGLISGIFVTVCCFLRNPRIIRSYYKKVKSFIDQPEHTTGIAKISRNLDSRRHQQQTGLSDKKLK